MPSIELSNWHLYNTLELSIFASFKLCYAKYDTQVRVTCTDTDIAHTGGSVKAFNTFLSYMHVHTCIYTPSAFNLYTMHSLALNYNCKIRLPVQSPSVSCYPCTTHTWHNIICHMLYVLCVAIFGLLSLG